MESEAATLTPAMQQYMAAKRQHPDALLFFRMGDFYEMFYEDAVTASRELQITLTSRDKERSVPMCGVPYHAAETYLTRLLRKGFKVAVCEQMEDPKLAKKIVRREVTRVYTPGTALDATLDQGRNNYLAAIRVRTDAAALALLDLSTGEFVAMEQAGRGALAAMLDELQKAQPSEVLLDAAMPADAAAELDAALEPTVARTKIDPWAWEPQHAIALVERQLGVQSLEGFGLAEHGAAACAAGAIVHYVQATQKMEAVPLDTLRFVERTRGLQMDQVTVRNLELVEPLVAGQDQKTTLWRTLDQCVTAMGKRLLRTTILRPLSDAETIEARYEAVQEATEDLIRRETIRESMRGILDLERLLARVTLDSAGPRDLVAIATSASHLPEVRRQMTGWRAKLWRRLTEQLDSLEDLVAAVRMTLVLEPPLTLADGGAIASGVDEELDRLRGLSRDARQSIAAIEERERGRTGIGSLKVRYNSVFGYYIEISKSNLALAPADYERKQTLVNAERFTTPELKAYERDVLSAQERSIELEKMLFAALRQNLLAAAGRIRASAAAVAETDLLTCFAQSASERGYVRPQLSDEIVLEARAGRHPVIEQWMRTGGVERFIPNDVYVHAEGPSLLLMTGPNMGGKSTYLRQAAMLVLMAQMGSFVPASAMRYGLVDRIFTRIGASDNVARGRSTFMVEMTETATILNTATKRALILLDEMGRGTATFDGLSLAWAAVEYLHAEIGARTLFATHYHELTMLAETLERARNLRVAVKESAGRITFLHTIEQGAASKSYGIEVARLAGLPRAVLERARHVLRQHEKQEQRSVQTEESTPMQLTMFTPLSQRIVDRIRETEINSLTPLQALNLLEELKRELEEAGGSGAGRTEGGR
jgi:DNA mismatch repair protein MutS